MIRRVRGVDTLRGVVRLALAIALVFSVSGCELVRTIFPSSDHDEVAPDLPAELGSPAVLIFSKTNGYRHTEAIDAGIPALEAIAAKRGWDVFATENGAIHSAEALSNFDAVIWFNVSGDVLADDQRAALLSYVEGGGAFLGVHGTGGDPSYKWEDHPGKLIGAQFIGHPMGPQFQEATIHIEARDHPVMQDLDAKWSRVDEWYSFEKSPRGPGVQVLATLDESTYTPQMKIAIIDRDLRMGADHPIIWTHCLGRGRALYSALGHEAAAYNEPKHLQFLEQAMAWLVERPSGGCRLP